MTCTSCICIVERTLKKMDGIPYVSVNLANEKALVINPDGKELTIPVEAVKPGSIILIKTGQQIPLDGIVKRGTALVDQSMISGEPLPGRRDGGEEVIGGTLVTQGVLTVEVTKVGEHYFTSIISTGILARAAQYPQSIAEQLNHLPAAQNQNTESEI